MKTLALSIFVSTTALCALGQNWIDVNAPYNNWNCVVSSADGVKLVALATNNVIYLSTNSGATWCLSSAPAKPWTSVATSADGAKLVAVARTGFIYTSTNSGVTWNPANVISNGWLRVVSSLDGTRLAALGYNYIASIYVSTNSGASWNLGSATNHPYGFGSALASSGDGSRLTEVALPQDGSGWYYYSTNSAMSWSLSSLGRGWSSLVSSADGGKLVGIAAGLAVSTNLATGWTIKALPSGASVLAASYDCTKLVVGVRGGPIYTSSNGGDSWKTHNVLHVQWSSIASSADGSKLVAVSLDGGIFTYQSVPTLAIARSGANAVITWSASGAGFVLQQNADLSTTNWVPVTNTPALVDGQSQIVLPLSAATFFYRLRSP